MDKATFIKIINNSIAQKDIQKVIYDYCIEMGKTEKDTDTFVSLLMVTPFAIPCFNTAIDYYKRKFNITSVIDANNNTLKNY